MSWTVTADPKQFEEAVAWFRERVPINKDAWKQLSEDAREKAFTVAEVANLGVLEDVWTALDRAVSEGTTLEDFRKEVGEKLFDAWGGRDPWRLETIFRTNVQQAYGAGRFAQMSDPAVLRRRPYWRFSAIMDARTSPFCRPLHGVTKPADDGFWADHYPPLHFSCRSDVMAVTGAEAKSYGVTEDAPGVAAQGGFGRTPARSWSTDWARNVIAEKGTKWAPLDGLPTAASLGLPEIGAEPLPGALLPRVSEVGEEAFLKRLEEAWGASSVVAKDPTGGNVVLSKDLLRPHVGSSGDGRERFLGLAPDTASRPSEIWLVPGRKAASGPVELRKVYLKRYEDPKRDRNVWVAGGWRKGGWHAVTVVESEDARALEKQRRGYRIWPKGEK